MNIAKIIGAIQDLDAKENIREKKFATLAIRRSKMIITLIGVTIIGFICTYTYVVINRRDIEQKQEELQRENEIIQAKLKQEEERRIQAINKYNYDPEI